MLTIYGRNNSSNVRKVLWLCEEFELKYDRLDYGRGFKSPNSPEYLELNPNAYVPTISDDGFVLWESNSIVRYLCSKHNRADLLPTDLQKRAIVDQWMDWTLATLTPAIAPFFHWLVVGNEKYGAPEIQAEALVNGTRILGILDAQLAKTGRYAAGDSITAADFSMGIYVHRWFTMDIQQRPDLPNLSTYYALLSERPAYQETIVKIGP